MSRAFIKESDDQWLDEIAPTMKSLIAYLTKENNGISVYEKGSLTDPETGKSIHEMSNGFLYTIKDGHWHMISTEQY